MRTDNNKIRLPTSWINCLFYFIFFNFNFNFFFFQSAFVVGFSVCIYVNTWQEGLSLVPHRITAGPILACSLHSFFIGRRSTVVCVARILFFLFSEKEETIPQFVIQRWDESDDYTLLRLKEKKSRFFFLFSQHVPHLLKSPVFFFSTVTCRFTVAMSPSPPT